VEDLGSIFKFQQALQVKIEPERQSSQLTNRQGCVGVGGRKVMLNVSDLHWNQIVIEEQVEKNLVELGKLTDSSKLVAEVVMVDVLFELDDGPFPC
jgi:hypothetical protein